MRLSAPDRLAVLGDAPHRVAEPGQPHPRVGLPHRQVDQVGRHPVPGARRPRPASRPAPARAPTVAADDRLAPREQPLPQRAGDDGEQHVVDGAAVGLADLLDVVESARATATRRCRPTGAFSGLCGAGEQAVRAVRSSPPATPVSRAAVARTSVTAPRAVSTIAEGRRAYSSSASHDQLARRSGGRSGRHSAGSGRRRVGLDVEQHLADVDRAQPVDQRRMGLGDDRHPAVARGPRPGTSPTADAGGPAAARPAATPGPAAAPRSPGGAARCGARGRRCRSRGRRPRPGWPGDPAPRPPAAGSAAPAGAGPRTSAASASTPPGGASRMRTPPTCIGVPGSSRYRKEASRLVSRSTIDLLTG